MPHAQARPSAHLPPRLPLDSLLYVLIDTMLASAELASLAVYVLGSLFPEPVPTRSTATRPNSTPTAPNPRTSAYSLPSPPPDTPPTSPTPDYYSAGSYSDSPPSFCHATPPAHVRPSVRGASAATAPSAYAFQPHSTRSVPAACPSPTSHAPSVVSLYEFVEYTLVRTRLAVPTFHKALILLTKLKSRYPRASGTSLAGHRLFVASAMLACGMDMDDAYRRSSWVEVCRGLFTARQLGQMETEVSGHDLFATPSRSTTKTDLAHPFTQMLAFLGFSAHVTDAELVSWMRLFVLPYCLANHSLAPLSGFGSPAAQAAIFATSPLASAEQPSWLTAAPAPDFKFNSIETPPSPPASPVRAGVLEGAPPSPQLVAWQYNVGKDRS